LISLRNATKEFWPPVNFIRQLEDKYGFKRHGSSEVIGNFEVQRVDLTPLQLNVSVSTPFVVDPRLSGHKSVSIELIMERIPELRKVLRASESPFVILVIGGALDGLAGEATRFGSQAVAVIDGPVIESMEKAEEAEDRRAAWKPLVARLVWCLGRHALSPYVAGRIAIGGRFFGRVNILNRTISGKQGGNFTIIGNRRIGKTSLLKEIKRRLLRDNDRLRTADVYGNKCHSTYDVVKDILTHLRPEIAERLPGERHLVENLPAHIAFLPEVRNDDVAVFIDEVDAILEFDEPQQYELLHLLRATFEHERCRVFFAGFRRVSEAMQNIGTPLYNFTQPIPLTGLSQAETRDMIIGPMSRLGIEVPPDLPAAIVQETGGHPELIQMFCSEVVNFYFSRQQPPSVNELLNVLLENESFRNAVYGSFLKNTNPFEKILCYSLFRKAANDGARVEGFEFTPRTCDELLSALGLRMDRSSLDMLLQNLRIGGVLAEVKGTVGGRYRFAVPRLAQYCLADDLEWSILKEKEELATNPRPISLQMEPENIGDEGQ
jgi:hypothetical protein